MLPFLAAAGLTGGMDFLGQFLGHKLNQGMDQKNLARLMALFSPESIGQNANQFMDIFQHSPIYSTMRNRAMQSSNILGNQLQTNYARAGLGGSALGRTAPVLARGQITRGLNDVDMDLFRQSIAQAFGRAGSIAGAMNQYPMFSPFGQALGGAIGNFGPMAGRIMDRYYPNDQTSSNNYTLPSANI